VGRCDRSEGYPQGSLGNRSRCLDDIAWRVGPVAHLPSAPGITGESRSLIRQFVRRDGFLRVALLARQPNDFARESPCELRHLIADAGVLLGKLVFLSPFELLIL
jgi:hypothetical protein